MACSRLPEKPCELRAHVRSAFLDGVTCSGWHHRLVRTEHRTAPRMPQLTRTCNRGVDNTGRSCSCVSWGPTIKPLATPSELQDVRIFAYLCALIVRTSTTLMFLVCLLAPDSGPKASTQLGKVHTVPQADIFISPCSIELPGMRVKHA